MNCLINFKLFAFFLFLPLFLLCSAWYNFLESTAALYTVPLLTYNLLMHNIL